MNVNQTVFPLENGYLTPFEKKSLRKSLQSELREEFRQRILIMLLADEGQSQAQICHALNCAAETARYWTYMARTGNSHLWAEISIGRPRRVDDRYLQQLREVVQTPPRELGYPFRQWTANKLSQHLETLSGIKISDRHISRLLKQMGLSTRFKHQAPVASDLPSSVIQIRDL